MYINRIWPAAWALLVFAALTGPCFAGPVFSFQYSMPAPPESTLFDVFAAGTLTTSDFDASLGAYLVTGISGTRTVNGVIFPITGLTPPGGYAGNSNLLYISGNFLDLSGLSFTVPTTYGSNDGSGNVNVFYDPGWGSYTENSLYVGLGDFTAVQTPEPAGGVMLLLGIAALTLGAGRRRH